MLKRLIGWVRYNWLHTCPACGSKCGSGMLGHLRENFCTKCRWKELVDCGMPPPKFVCFHCGGRVPCGCHNNE